MRGKMRRYTHLARAGFAVVGLIGFALGLLLAYFILTDPAFRSGDVLLACGGALGAAILFLKITFSGTSFRFFEIRVDRLLDTDETPEEDRSPR